MAKKKKLDEETSNKEQSGIDTQKLWVERIRRAKKCKEDWKKTNRVDLGIAYFAGKQNPGVPENEWITINKIYAHLSAQLPGLYSVDPYFYVKVKKSYSVDPDEIAKFEQRAKIRQAYLNYLKGELKLKPKARLGTQDAFFYFGALKVLYQADKYKNPDAGKQIEEYKDEEGKPVVEPDVIPINERYSITRIHPDDILFSDDCGPLEDKWPWLAERIRLTKEEAESDPDLNSEILKTIKPEYDDKEKEKNNQYGAKPKEDEPYTYWEVYDLKNKKWLKICEGATAPLKEPTELPKGVESHPYSFLRFTLQDNSAYPIPPVSQMLDPQKELCLARSRYMTHRKRFNRKYEVQVNALADENELDKLESGEDGTIIRKQQSAPVVTPIQDAPLDQNGWTEIMHLSNDLNEISGYSGPARGVSDSDSATEAGILEKHLNVREGDRMSIVMDWILEAAEKLDQLVQANISRDEAVKISGPQGEFWEQVRVQDYEEIDGQFQYSVNIGSTFPQLPQVERAQWMAFLTLLSSFPQLLLNDHFMKRMAEMHHIEDDAMLEELKQMGQQMMSGQLPMPGQQGSQAGIPLALPGTASAGMAGGPAGGLVNGGGSVARDGTP